MRLARSVLSKVYLCAEQRIIMCSAASDHVLTSVRTYAAQRPNLCSQPISAVLNNVLGIRNISQM
jgi:hypothetical protein